MDAASTSGARATSRIWEYACHEGNYAMGNILRGARLLEKEAVAKRAASGGGASR